MRTIQLIMFAVVAAFFVAPPSARAAQGRASVHAILVVASNDAGPTDSRLAPYEANLKSSLGRKSFHYQGEGSAAVAGGGKGNISLANGHNLELSNEGGRVKVHFGSADIVLSAGQTVVLAGRNAGGRGDVFAVIVMVN
jgi:hypothetical protein